MQCLLVTSVFWVFEFDLFLFVHVSPHGDVKGCGGVFVETGAAVTQTGQTEHSSPKQNPNVLLRVRDGKLSISQGEVQSLFSPHICGVKFDRRTNHTGVKSIHHSFDTDCKIVCKCVNTDRSC